MGAKVSLISKESMLVIVSVIRREVVAQCLNVEGRSWVGLRLGRMRDGEP